MIYNGVILTTTGDLLRCGFCDFENDGSFNASTEIYRTDVPFPACVVDDPDETQFHRWNGSAWILIDK